MGMALQQIYIESRHKHCWIATSTRESYLLILEHLHLLSKYFEDKSGKLGGL